MNKISDKRKSSRRQCAVFVEGQEGVPFSSCQTTDISRGGVGFISSQAVAVDTKIPIEIRLSPDSESVIVMGRVKWIQKLPDAIHYRMGLAFDDFIDGTAALLNKYCTV